MNVLVLMMMLVLVVMIVMDMCMVVMMMVVRVMVGLGRLGQDAADALVHHPRADRYDGQAGNRAEHLSDLFRHDVLEQEQRRESQQEHADGVREGHYRAQKHGVLESAARANQVRRHDGFSMTGGQRVRGAQREGYDDRDQDHAQCQFTLM